MEKNGLFISFEGGEGAGKSTQIKLLGEHLSSQGYQILSLREPGGTPIGEEIRHILKNSSSGYAMNPETELLLMNGSRAQLVRETIRPALSKGKIVLCDRFYDSTIAYQQYGRGLNSYDVRNVIEFAVGDTKPDLTFLININLDQSEKNRTIRNSALPFIKDRFEEEDRKFFERVHFGFSEIARLEPGRVKVIPYVDGNIGAMQKQMQDITMNFIHSHSRLSSKSQNP